MNEVPYWHAIAVWPCGKLEHIDSRVYTFKLDLNRPRIGRSTGTSFFLGAMACEIWFLPSLLGVTSTNICNASNACNFVRWQPPRPNNWAPGPGSALSTMGQKVGILATWRVTFNNLCTWQCENKQQCCILTASGATETSPNLQSTSMLPYL